MNKRFENILEKGVKKSFISFFIVLGIMILSLCPMSAQAKTKTITKKQTIYIKKIKDKKKISFSGKLKSAKSSNKKIVSVTKGKKKVTLKGNKYGTAKVTIQSYVKKKKNKTNYKYIYTVKVGTPVKSISIDSYYDEMNVGESYKVGITVKPSNATNKKLSWTSSNPRVANISNNVITAYAPGRTTFTVKSTDGSNVHVSFNVRVYASDNGGNTNSGNNNSGGNTTPTVGNKDIKVSSVSIGGIRRSIKVGESYTLSTTVSPSNATNKKLSFSSSNPSVAVIDSNGKITGKGVGTSTITIATTDGTNIRQTFVLTVNKATVPVTGMNVSPDSLSMAIGETKQISAQVTPSNASNPKINYTSTNSSIASVSTSGAVTGKAAGSTTITVSSAENPNMKISIPVSVSKKDTTVPVSGLKVSPDSISVKMGNTKQITAQITPSNASNQKVNYVSANTGIATVSSTGLVTGKALGQTTITVSAAENSAVKITIPVTVTENTVEISSLALSGIRNEIEVGESYTLTARVEPDNATNKTIKFTSSNTNVATITSDGKITGLKVGVSTITAETQDGSNLKKSFTLVVNPKSSGSGSGDIIPATSLKVSKIPSGDLQVGKSYTLVATVSPENATDKTVTWKSSNPSIATVDNGTIHCLKTGVVTISASLSNGASWKRDFTITDVIKVESLSLSKIPSDALAIGDSFTLEAEILPTNASNQTLKWESSDNSIATVNNGTVNCLKEGDVTITVSTTDGSNISLNESFHILKEKHVYEPDITIH